MCWSCRPSFWPGQLYVGGPSRTGFCISSQGGPLCQKRWYHLCVVKVKISWIWSYFSIVDPKRRKKPSSQTVGADPSQCNSTCRQNPPFYQNCCNFWTNIAILMPFEVKNILTFVNLVYFMTGSNISIWARRRCTDIVHLGWLSQTLNQWRQCL